MAVIISRLTVLFEEPFWVGIYERECDGNYEVCKITFGAEPKDYEVYNFMMKNCYKLRFSPSIEAESVAVRRINPKRMQRLIKRQIADTSIGTKAQQALKLQQEQDKSDRKTRFRNTCEAEKQQQFELHKQKKKAKHRGH